MMNYCSLIPEFSIANVLGVPSEFGHQILQGLSLTLFEKTPILRVLQQIDSQDDLPCPVNQLNLFNLYPDSSDL
jgi:hypothetical protein